MWAEELQCIERRVSPLKDVMTRDFGTQGHRRGRVGVNEWGVSRGVPSNGVMARQAVLLA